MLPHDRGCAPSEHATAIRRAFRLSHVVAMVNRMGVVTVNGQELPPTNMAPLLDALLQWGKRLTAHRTRGPVVVKFSSHHLLAPFVHSSKSFVSHRAVIES